MMFKQRMNADAAKQLFLSAFSPLTETETLRIEDSDGRVCAENLTAPLNIPCYRRAAMDGFAVISSDTLGTSANSPVILRLGTCMEKGACVRVHTGSPLPHGADAVVMLEDTVLHEGSVEVFVQVHPFKNVGEVGEDIKKGEIILKEGCRLRPCDIAVLASMGIRNIKVFRKPRVAIIPTGEELVSRDKEILEEGQVYESNGIMAWLYIKKWGGDAKLLDIVPDSPEKIKEAIINNSDADMIITSGGTSVGKRDHVASVVASVGKLLVHGVGISPGKPTALGIINDVPIVCMPGYPAAGMVALYFFAKPALLKLCSLKDISVRKEESECAERTGWTERIVKAALSEKLPGRTGYRTFARVKLIDGMAVPLATSGAGILSSVSKADGFVTIPENVEGYEKGEIVEVVEIE